MIHMITRVLEDVLSDVRGEDLALVQMANIWDKVKEAEESIEESKYNKLNIKMRKIFDELLFNSSIEIENLGWERRI